MCQRDIKSCLKWHRKRCTNKQIDRHFHIYISRHNPSWNVPRIQSFIIFIIKILINIFFILWAKTGQEIYTFHYFPSSSTLLKIQTSVFREFVIHVVRYFGLSLKFGNTHIYQSMPRLLSLWLDSGTAVADLERKDRGKSSGKLTTLRTMLGRINSVNVYIKTEAKWWKIKYSGTWQNHFHLPFKNCCILLIFWEQRRFIKEINTFLLCISR